ncbi:MAG: MFS transporter [Armatimonadota bacterium]
MNTKWRVLAVVGIGTFMSALDGSIVNTILPVIGREARAPVSTLEWVVLIYLLTVVSTLLVFGRLADIYGHRGLYITGLLAFTVGSGLCTVAPSVPVLVALRAVQAAGASMLFAVGPAVLTRAFPGKERGRALGMQATVTYLGLATGPALGGLLAAHLGWRSVFYINLPIGLLAALLAARVIGKERPEKQPFDPWGAITLAAGLASLLFALTKGQELGWESPGIIACIATAVVALAAFLLVQKRNEHPLIDLGLFADRTFAASTIAAVLNYSATASVSFMLPFYLIQARGERVDVAGLVLIATPAVMALVASPAGWLSDRVGVRLPATLGMAITTGGILLLRTLTPETPIANVAAHLAVIGLGVGLFTSPNNSAIMGAAPPERRGVAGAVLAAARNMGFAIGVAIAGLVYTHELRTDPSSITQGMQSATTTVALLATPGIAASILRHRIRQ